MKHKALIITGPTATGKTSLAVKLAENLQTEIISADSRQVYRGLDVGTGKDLDEYGSIPYHLIDIVDPGEQFSLYHWRQAYIVAVQKIIDQQRIPVVCGGTALYLDMLLKDYALPGNARQGADEYSSKTDDDLKKLLKAESSEVYGQTDLTQRDRIIRGLQIARSLHVETTEKLPQMDYLVIAPYWHRTIVHQRIENRLKERWNAMIIETENLLNCGVTHERLQWFGLEYRSMSQLLSGEVSEKEAFDKLLIQIRKFAKRQDIWFRKIENSGQVIFWLNEENKFSQALDLTELFLTDKPLPKPDLKISEIFYGPRQSG